jgi:hypothetical protein
LEESPKRKEEKEMEASTKMKRGKRDGSIYNIKYPHLNDYLFI